MVSLGASFDGKTSILFIEHGVKINGPGYCQDVLTPMLSESRQKMPDFVFQQDSAQSSIAKSILKWRGRMQDVVKNGGGHVEPFIKN